MVLGFKQQFPHKICKEEKIHTLREDKNDRWHSGCIIHFATGVRTKLYRCFKLGVCIGTQRIEIRYHGDETFGTTIIVEIDGRRLGWNEIDTLAKNDGFDTTKDFLAWFKRDFFGKIIHWTNLKY